VCVCVCVDYIGFDCQSVYTRRSTVPLNLLVLID
jgi:hypothetical protein